MRTNPHLWEWRGLFTNPGRGLPGWVAALLKRSWEILVGSKLKINQQYALAVEKATAYQVVMTRI